MFDVRGPAPSRRGDPSGHSWFVAWATQPCAHIAFTEEQALFNAARGALRAEKGFA